MTSASTIHGVSLYINIYEYLLLLRVYVHTVHTCDMYVCIYDDMCVHVMFIQGGSCMYGTDLGVALCCAALRDVAVCCVVLQCVAVCSVHTREFVHVWHRSGWHMFIHIYDAMCQPCNA